MTSGSEKNNDLKIGLIPSISLIVANMIGTGVFTSLGYQSMGIKSVFALLFLWLIGGVIALSGALTYGELAVNLPRSGGEYNYLSKIYHPAIGFLSGWISSTVGFAAPMAASAIFFSQYFSKVFPYISPVQLSAALILVLTFINVLSFRVGSSFQTVFTIINILLILSITIAGIVLPDHSGFLITFNNSDIENIASPAFAVSLVYVSFAYSGWNSATYIAGEIRDPQRNLPKALFYGTFFVILLYLSLNFIFLYTLSVDELAENKNDFVYLAAQKIFGSEGAVIISLIISIGLIASVNSMMIAGPRVTQTIGEDFPFFKIMAHKNKKGSPLFAILFQSAISLILIFTSTFDKVVTYIGFTLSLFTTLTVAGIFILKYKNKSKDHTYKTWGYPVTPILFILLEIWMMVYIARERFVESIAGFLTILIGLVVFFILRTNKKETYSQT